MSESNQNKSNNLTKPNTADGMGLASSALLSLGKAGIVIVGTIEGGQPKGFGFDGSTVIDGMHFSDEPRWGGWTLDELREVIARPSEFCDNV